MATWNVWTKLIQGKMKEINKEMTKYKTDIIDCSQEEEKEDLV
jgi:hypothetical protein